MIQKNKTGGFDALLSRHARLLLLLILIFSLVMAGCQSGLIPNDPDVQNSVYVGDTVSKIHEEDPVLSLLGKSFNEIKQVLGEPDDQGYGDWLGPHQYLLYESEKGFIQFCSPESNVSGIVISIFLGEGLAVLGAKIGMSFQEIADILGEPDLGPEIGMDNYFYADYFSGEIINGVPEIFISFVASSMDSPTKYALVKWEAFNEEETETIEIKK